MSSHLSSIRLLALVLAGLHVFGISTAYAQDVAETADSTLQVHEFFSAPVREPVPALFDQEHVRLALRFEPSAGRIFGVSKIRIRPLSDTLNTIQFASRGMEIYNVQIGVMDSVKTDARFETSSENTVAIHLDSLSVRGVPFEVQITYRADPIAGMNFRKVSPADTSYKIHIWTDGTFEGNRFWIPLLDNPADRLTSEIIATVPPSLEVLSNGRVTEQMETDDGMALYHYVQDQNHLPGNISLFVGHFLKADLSATMANGFSIPVRHWMSDRTAKAATTSLSEAPEMLSFFSQKLDFTYPWPAYSEVIFDEAFISNISSTGFTVYNDRILLDERAAIDQPNTLELATNIARQWYGHMISVDHWSDIWLTESLASFLGLMYIRHSKGDASYFAQLNKLADDYLQEARQYERPLVWNQWYDPASLLDQHTKAKGVWFFHSLHEKLGDEKFWTFLQGFTREQAFKSTNTDKLLAALSTSQEGEFGGFFDDWLYSAGHPQIELDYQYDLVSESLYVSIEQLQEGYLKSPVFQMNLPIETYSLAGANRTNLAVTKRDQLFSIPMAIQPRYVILDPDHTLLSEIKVDQPASAWVSQLRYASHPLSQLSALEHLKAFADDPALVIGLQNALSSRPIPEVRAGIITVIAMLPESDATKRTLLETYENDESPLVKRAVMQGLEKFEDKSDLIIMAMEAAQTAQSYLLQAQAVESLVRINAPNAGDILQSALITPSYKDIIRCTALKSIAYTSMPTRERVSIGVEYVKPRHTIEARLAAMDLLARLASLGNKRSSTTLVDLLEDDQAVIRQQAADYVGNFGSEDDLKALQRQLETEHNPMVVPALKAASRALETRLTNPSTL